MASCKIQILEWSCGIIYACNEWSTGVDEWKDLITDKGWAKIQPHQMIMTLKQKQGDKQVFGTLFTPE